MNQTAARRVRPVRGQIYTMAQIDNELELLDGPHLAVAIPGPLVGLDLGQVSYRGYPIQDAHLERYFSEISATWADTRWEYLWTTHEWIPVFRSVDPGDVIPLLDICCAYDLIMQEYQVSLCPKGFVRDMMDHITVADYQRNFASGGDGYELVWQRDRLNGS